MNKRFPSLRLAHILALIPIGAVLIHIIQPQMIPFQPLEMTALTGLYILVLVLAGRLKQGFWTGYIALATYVTWLTSGLSFALVLVALGTVISLPIYWYLIEKSEFTPEIISEILGRIAITGNGILVAHGVYQSLHGTIPFTHASPQQMIPLLAAMVCGYVVMQMIGVSVTGVNPINRFKSAGRGLLLEPLLVMVTIVLPLINASIGSVAFVIMIGLTGAQAIRHHQVRDAHSVLMLRLKDMSMLNNLSQTIAASIELDEVLDSIYREIRSLVNATTFFVALYNNDRQTIEYPLVLRNGQA